MKAAHAISRMRSRQGPVAGLTIVILIVFYCKRIFCNTTELQQEDSKIVGAGAYNITSGVSTIAQHASLFASIAISTYSATLLRQPWYSTGNTFRLEY